MVLDFFVYFWEHRKEIQIQLSLKAYIYQSVRNRCLNFLRDKEQVVHIDELTEAISVEDNSSLETEELYQLIAAVIENLLPNCKEVFRLSREENKTNKEIAEELNISVKTVEGHITKALKMIKELLDSKYYYLF